MQRVWAIASTLAENAHLGSDGLADSPLQQLHQRRKATQTCQCASEVEVDALGEAFPAANSDLAGAAAGSAGSRGTCACPDSDSPNADTCPIGEDSGEDDGSDWSLTGAISGVSSWVWGGGGGSGDVGGSGTSPATAAASLTPAVAHGPRPTSNATLWQVAASLYDKVWSGNLSVVNMLSALSSALGNSTTDATAAVAPSGGGIGFASYLTPSMLQQARRGLETFSSFLHIVQQVARLLLGYVWQMAAQVLVSLPSLVLFSSTLFYLLEAEDTWLASVLKAYVDDGTQEEVDDMLRSGEMGHEKGGYGLCCLVAVLMHARAHRLDECAVVSNIFTIHANNCIFAGLFTYLWWDVCGVRLRYTSSVLAAAAFVVPFFPTALLAVPGMLQLMLWDGWVQGAVFFLVYAGITYQVYWAFLGTGQHSHYSVLGLSIIAGISTFGLQGAVLGPLLTSAVSAMHQLLSRHVQGLRQRRWEEGGGGGGLGSSAVGGVSDSPFQSPILNSSHHRIFDTPATASQSVGLVRFAADESPSTADSGVRHDRLSPAADSVRGMPAAGRPVGGVAPAGSAAPAVVNAAVPVSLRDIGTSFRA